MNWPAHFQFARAFLRYAYDHRLIGGEQYMSLARGVNQTEKDLYACRSKDRFPTHNAAAGAVRKKYIDRRTQFEVYACLVCHGYHLATPNKLLRKKRLMRQQQEANGA